MIPSSASSVSSTPLSSGGTTSGRPPASSTASTYIAGISTAGSRQTPQLASWAYEVMPTTGLATLEEPLPFVARDDPVEELLLGARVVEVVVDHLVAEGAARHHPALERGDRLPQRVREPLGVRLVGVALERWR